MTRYHGIVFTLILEIITCFSIKTMTSIPDLTKKQQYQISCGIHCYNQQDSIVYVGGKLDFAFLIYNFNFEYYSVCRGLSFLASLQFGYANQLSFSVVGKIFIPLCLLVNSRYKVDMEAHKCFGFFLWPMMGNSMQCPSKQIII